MQPERSPTIDGPLDQSIRSARAVMLFPECCFRCSTGVLIASDLAAENGFRCNHSAHARSFTTTAARYHDSGGMSSTKDQISSVVPGEGVAMMSIVSLWLSRHRFEADILFTPMLIALAPYAIAPQTTLAAGRSSRPTHILERGQSAQAKHAPSILPGYLGLLKWSTL